MPLRVVGWIVVPLIVCVSICGILAHIAWTEAVGAVNRKLPPEEQFEYFGWYPLKTSRFRAEYRRLYPNGPLLRKIDRLFLLMCSSLLVAWVLLWTVR